VAGDERLGEGAPGEEGNEGDRFEDHDSCSPVSNGFAPQSLRGALPLYVALTRLRDHTPVVADVRASGDGGFSDNTPYEALFACGCDIVVRRLQKARVKEDSFATAPIADLGALRRA